MQSPKLCRCHSCLGFEALDKIGSFKTGDTGEKLSGQTCVKIVIYVIDGAEQSGWITT